MNKNGTTSGFDDRVDQLKESVRDVVDYGGTRAHAFRERLSDAKDSVLSGSGSAARRIGQLVKDHPFVAIGVAFGVGYLAIRIARR